jgi:DNA-binding MarR family transcriptional regulator
MTPLINKLKDKGLIQVKLAQDDRRNKIVNLTVKGRRLKAQAADIPDKLLCLVPFSKAEGEVLAGMMRRLHAALLEVEASRS